MYSSVVDQPFFLWKRNERQNVERCGRELTTRCICFPWLLLVVQHPSHGWRRTRSYRPISPPWQHKSPRSTMQTPPRRAARLFILSRWVRKSLVEWVGRVWRCPGGLMGREYWTYTEWMIWRRLLRRCRSFINSKTACKSGSFFRRPDCRFDRCEHCSPVMLQSLCLRCCALTLLVCVRV